MSDAGEPEARDWFRGARPAEAARTPRTVGEAFGHLRQKDAGTRDAVRDSDWFDAGSASASEQVPTEIAVVADATSPAEPTAEGASTLADSIEADPAGPTEPPAPESDARVRLRALTGGLADLSDALAAVGIESVALRNTATARPSAPAPAPAADFRVRCPDCGPQFVAVADVRFVETGDGAEANRYLFTCPACGARVRRPAGPELAEILKSSGVATLALRRGPGQAL